MYTIIYLVLDENDAMVPHAVYGELRPQHDQLLVECVHFAVQEAPLMLTQGPPLVVQARAMSPSGPHL